MGKFKRRPSDGRKRSDLHPRLVARTNVLPCRGEARGPTRHFAIVLLTNDTCTYGALSATLANVPPMHPRQDVAFQIVNVKQLQTGIE